MFGAIPKMDKVVYPGTAFNPFTIFVPTYRVHNNLYWYSPAYLGELLSNILGEFILRIARRKFISLISGSVSIHKLFPSTHSFQQVASQMLGAIWLPSFVYDRHVTYHSMTSL
jgi:hypothetical protein